MLRAVLLFILILLLVRAVVRGLAELRVAQPWRPSGRGNRGGSVHMVRDPICGTFVIPGRALALTDGTHQVFFCSAACRDHYRAQQPGRAPAEGRTA
jgi:hypothetical protein